MKRQLGSIGSLLRPSISRRLIATSHSRFGLISTRRCIPHQKGSPMLPAFGSQRIPTNHFIARCSLSSDVAAVWRQTTARLLEAPIGNFDDKMWSETRLTIIWWLEHSEGDSVRMSVRLLERMVKEEEAWLKEGNDDVGQDFFKTDLLNLVINHWRKIVAEQPSIRAEEDLHPCALVEKLEHFHFNSTRIKPDTQTFAMLIDGASSFTGNRDDKSDGVLVAERLLDWQIENSSKHPHVRPNVVTCSSMMNAWSKSSRPEAPGKVEKLLEDMKLLQAQNPDWDIAPNQVTYATAIDTWAKVGRVDRVEELLMEMHQEYREGAKELKPNITAFNGYLVALARAGDVDKAESVLAQMEELYSSGELDERPNVIAYSTVLDAFAKAKIDGAAGRAESMLRSMVEEGISPNAISYNSVIAAYVQSRNVERAEGLLREMHESFLQGNADVKPTIQTYTAVLSGWSKTRSPQAGERAEQLLDLMKDLAKSGELEHPDIVSYNSVLDCWAKSRIKDAPAKAREFLQKMIEEGIEPDIYSYNTVIHALTGAGSVLAVEKAMLDDMSAAGVNPDATTYNTLLDAWSKSGLKEAPRRASELFSRMKEGGTQPDLFTYNTLMHFHSKTGNAELAESMLEEICLADSPVRADRVSFNTAIAAWSRSGRVQAPQRAEAIFDRMLDFGSGVRPDSITVNSMMATWIKSKKPEAAGQCARLFEMMKEMNIKPDVVTYNTVIRSSVLSSDDEAPEKAEAAFEDMQRRYKRGDRRLKATGKTYGSLINVWSRSERANSGEKAEEYLRLLIEKAASGEVKEPPREFEFTATIRAWVNSGDPRALYKADEVFRLLLEQPRKGNRGARPNAKTFGAILTALASSNTANKAKHADRIISLMKEYRVAPDRFNVKLLEKCYAERNKLPLREGF